MDDSKIEELKRRIEEEVTPLTEGLKNQEPFEENDNKTKEEVTWFNTEPKSLSEAPKGHRKFSDVVGFEPEGPDFFVKVYDPSELSEGALKDVPELKDFEDVTIEDIDRSALETFARAVSEGQKVRLVGEVGVGKTTLPKYFCALVGKPFHRMNFHPETEASDILGGYKIIDGETVWVDGDIPRLMQEPYELLLDEIYRGSARLQMALQGMLEQGGVLKINDRHDANNVYMPHADFNICCSDNTKGLGDGADHFPSAMVQDVSTMDRFEVTLEMGYPEADKEQEQTLRQFPNISETFARRIVQLANYTRDAVRQETISVPFSRRTVKTIVKNAELYRNPVHAIRISYFNRLADESEKQAFSQFVRDVDFDEEKFGKLFG